MVLTTVPRHVERIWGSMLIPGRGPVGEIWWLYDGPDGSSPLLEAGTMRPAGCLGDLASRPGFPVSSPFPLLVKTLHTADRLSVQVHPGASGGSECKAETWIFLEAAPDAVVYAGLSRGCDLEMLRRCSARCDFTGALEEWRVMPGDIMHLPPGTVHALGRGLEVLEIQTNCDITYRLFDWNRICSDGKPRELHIEKALACTDPEHGRPRLAARGGKPPVEGAGYRIECICGGDMALETGWVVFMTEGTAMHGAIAAPACLVADSAASVPVEGTGVLAVWEGPA